MKKTRISFLSSEGTVTLHGFHWCPDQEPEAVLVLCHGMAEHIRRYDEFARAMAGAGIAVLGMDLLGHGDSLNKEGELGFFAERHGDRILVRDLHLAVQTAHQLHPGKPVFVLGHSIGSFILRRYITRWGAETDGVILVGTGTIPRRIARFGIALADWICRKKGKHARSRLLQFMAEGKYSLPYLLPWKKGSWLSKNQESLKAYAEDPRCGFCFTAGAYLDLFRMLENLAREKDMEKIPRTLPVLLCAGMEDPVGSKSREVLEVYNSLVAKGFRDLDIYLYEKDRHEILQELDRDKVFSDIQNWILDRCHKL